jgi:hypothetical protein
MMRKLKAKRRDPRGDSQLLHEYNLQFAKEHQGPKVGQGLEKVPKAAHGRVLCN